MLVAFQIGNRHTALITSHLTKQPVHFIIEQRNPLLNRGPRKKQLGKKEEPRRAAATMLVKSVDT